MNREERVRAVVDGKEPDRVPVSVWFHFSKYDQDPVSLADAEASFVDTYDFDFIKMMPFGNYGIQDFGAKLIFTARPASQSHWPGRALPIEKDIKIGTDLRLQGTYGKQVEFARLLAKKCLPIHRLSRLFSARLRRFIS